MSKCKVSLVMPVYNCGKYLKKNLDSYINQTMTEWELILVDDGSKDNSWDIISRYAAKDSRIKAIHKENGGVVSARQTGMREASGEYLLQVDADDWVERNMLEDLYETAVSTNSDMVWCDCFCNDSGVWKQSCPEDPLVMVHAILTGKIWGVVWNKLIKTSIAKKYGVIPWNISMWEDFAFLIPCLLHMSKITYLEKAYYHYNIDNGDSMVHSTGSKNMSDEYCLVMDFVDSVIKDANMMEEFKYDLDLKKLISVRDYVDDLRHRDLTKFMTKYPEAIDNIWKYKEIPLRLKLISNLLKYNLSFLVQPVWRIDLLLRKIRIK